MNFDVVLQNRCYCFHQGPKSDGKPGSATEAKAKARARANLKRRNEGRVSFPEMYLPSL